MIRHLILTLTILFLAFPNLNSVEPMAQHVILISFDGLRPDAITTLGPQKASAFYKMITEGASTLNARSDYNFTVTLPNHACMITGYPVYGSKGHHLTVDSLGNKTIHDFAGRRIYSIFDVLRKYHRHSAMLASKLKFNIYERSFPIDTVLLTELDDQRTMENFRNLLSKGLPDFVFMHFSGADYAGHTEGWSLLSGSAYMKKVEILNGYLETILNDVDSAEHLRNSTVVIVTSDHGGEGRSHSDKTNFHDFTVPLIIWGKPVAKGVDLYRINTDRRKDPLNERVPYNQQGQPISNGDTANLALSLLGLPPVEGSTIGYEKPLKITKDPN